MAYVIHYMLPASYSISERLSEQPIEAETVQRIQCADQEHEGCERDPNWHRAYGS